MHIFVVKGRFQFEYVLPLDAPNGWHSKAEAASCCTVCQPKAPDFLSKCICVVDSVTQQMALCTATAENDLREVADYLRSLSKSKITELGIQLGLSYRWLKDYESSANYRYDVVDAWLKRQDSVADIRPPTWQNMVAALREVNQNGIATQVTAERGNMKLGYAYRSAV